MSKKIIFAALFIGGMAFISCKNSENKTDGSASDSVKTSGAAPADSSAHKAMYVCPMHPEETSDKPGKCPKCGMDLELKS